MYWREPKSHDGRAGGSGVGVGVGVKVKVRELIPTCLPPSRYEPFCWFMISGWRVEKLDSALKPQLLLKKNKGQANAELKPFL